MTSDAEYTPRGRTAAILDRAWELVRNVPYQVSARWVFYLLLQEGWYTSKDDYKNKWLKAVSNARHAFYKAWRPDTLADETREAITRSGGAVSVPDWLDLVTSKLTCHLDKWHGQPHYLQLWYEARAMTQQFAHYTQHIDLIPMGGQPSIPYKWEVAKSIEEAARLYQVPAVILYFGDLDEAGQSIADVAQRDVQKWCGVDFDFIRCGLTLEQVRRHNVPENFEKPGAYQWEALTDEAAREIITGAVDPYLRHDAFSQVMAQEDGATRWVRAELAGLAQRWGKKKSELR